MLYFADKSNYCSTKDKIKLDLSQSEISELHDMCDEIIDICRKYIKFIWKEVIEDTGNLCMRYECHLRWNCYYKKYIKGTTKYVNGAIMRPYLYEIDKAADDIIPAIQESESSKPAADYKDKMQSRCKKLKAIMGGQYSRTLVFDANKHETLTKINSRRAITIPGFKKKIPLRGQFKCCLDDDKVKRIFVDIGCPRPGIVMYATANLGFKKMTEKEMYNYDSDGYYKLRKKGDTYNEFLRKKYYK